MKLDTLEVKVTFDSKSLDKVAKAWTNLLQLNIDKLILEKNWKDKLAQKSRIDQEEADAQNAITRKNEEIRYATIQYDEFVEQSIFAKIIGK
jgi:hypothetical protein